MRAQTHTHTHIFDSQVLSKQRKCKFAAEQMDNEVDNAKVDEGWESWDISAETVCCICDDGGDVIYCDGECFRSFHLSKGASECPSLGLSKAESERMDKFLCPNCKFKIHQCFACKQLGSSDAAAPEVFKCKVAMCGHYYHPSCVAKLILKVKDTSDECIAMVESIKQGNRFDCPRHKCRKCGAGEDKENVDMQFGICRRCPRAWHRQCLPHSILYPKADELQRAWDNLLLNRILIYCERHTIIPNLGTPARNHVMFPEALLRSLQKRSVKRKAEVEEQKRKLSKLSFLKKRDEACVKSLAGEITGKLRKSNTEKKAIGQTKPEDRGFTKSKLNEDSLVLQGLITKVSKQAPTVFIIKRKNKVGSSARQEWSSKEDERKVSKPCELSLLSNHTSVFDAKLERTSSMVSKPRGSQLQKKSKPLESKPIIVDIETRGMVEGIIGRAKSSITIESVTEKHVVPDYFKWNPMNLDKVYTLIEIESTVQGMHKALETLDNGGSIEDAKVKLEMCHRHLRAYLCPFLHGGRYTSYGRHFTHPTKLAEIVERLHWYVDNEDMVVDFCCGFNDFSLLMKQKLEETGKKCEYKNFDLIQTNKDFNFFKGDWFEVKQDQFPDGNRLIMGLNPPFGLANQFINHALKFKPKLIILIVPRETERLDQKHDMYDLIWEDSDLLAGRKAFFLPGSLDEDGNTMDDWNIITSPLYVWSKPNWTLKHKQIALERGQISSNTSSRYVGSPWSKSSLWLPLPSDFEIEKDNNYAAPMEHGGGEASNSEQNKNRMSLAEPSVMREPKDGQVTGPKQEHSNSFNLKEQDKRSIEQLECNMDGVEPNIVNEHTDKQETTPIQDKSGSFKLKVLNKRSRDPSECRNGERSDVASFSKFDTQVNDISSESSVVVQVEDTSHKEQSTIEHPRSPERATHSFGFRDDVLGKQRKSNERHKLGNHTNLGVQTDENYQQERLSRLARSASRYDNVANAGSKNLETQGKFPSKGLHGQEAASVRDQVPLHMQLSGRSGDTVLATQNRSIGLNHSGAPRGMHGMQEMNYASDRYGMPLQTDGLPRARGAGRGSAISEKSFRPLHGNSGRGWPSIVRPSNFVPVCPSVYGSFRPQQRPPLGLHNPSQFSSHNPLSSGPACPQTNLPHYPPIQKNEHATGGWFED